MMALPDNTLAELSPVMNELDAAEAFRMPPFKLKLPVPVVFVTDPTVSVPPFKYTVPLPPFAQRFSDGATTVAESCTVNKQVKVVAELLLHNEIPEVVETDALLRLVKLQVPDEALPT